MSESGTLLFEGREALASANWERAAEIFEVAESEAPSAASAHGLARALWWLGRVRESVAAGEDAYRRMRDAGDDAAAIRMALWLAEEHDAGLGEPDVGSGWLGRAASLVDAAGPAGSGWLSLARARRTENVETMARLAQEAVDAGRAVPDRDLEVRALARLGIARAAAGQVDVGLACFDQAMVAATSEPVELETVGETYCDAFALIEVVGDMRRLAQWTDVLQRFMSRHRYGPLVSFCGACCGELFSRAGDVVGAEKELVRALDKLRSVGGGSRCAHPAARLAELRISEGRIEDAERILADYAGLPEVTRAEADLALAAKRPAVAAALLDRRLDAMGSDSLLSIPFLTRLVSARLAMGDLPAATKAADRLAEIAESAESVKVGLEAAGAVARVAAAAREPAAVELLERALDGFTRNRLPVDAARIRVLLAEARRELDPEVALEDARSAMATFDRANLRLDADATARLVRDLGGRIAPKPRVAGVLTKRELEVLDLVSDGLTNAEIAERLFISAKTADHHVSRILTKLGVRNRVEAAALANQRSHRAD